MATENVQRQIAVIAVVSMKESCRLMAMQRIVRGVDVQHDFFRRFRMHLQKHVDKERLIL